MISPVHPRALTSRTSGQVVPREVVIIAAMLISAACWIVLARWYLLVEHISRRGFALDRLPGHFASPRLRHTLLLFAVLMSAYGLNLWLIKSLPVISRSIKAAVLGTALISGVANVLLYPVAAIDVFYYVLELKLAYHYQQNPYLVPFVPTFAADPAAPFGWPLHVPLAYGPAWLMLGRLPTLASRFDDLARLLLFYKGFSLVLVLLMAVVVFYVKQGEKHRWLGVYALLGNPFLMFEAVGNAHNDVVMTLFVLAAILALKRRSWLGGPLLALASLVKIFAVVLVPLFLLASWRDRWTLRSVLLAGAAAVVASGLVILPFWAGGGMIQGMLKGMEFANKLITASLTSFVRISLRDHQAPPETLETIRVAFAGLFAVAALLVAWLVRDVERAAVCVLLLLFTLVGSLQPWYWIPAVALLALHHDRRAAAYLFVASAIAFHIYFLDVWARFNSGMTFFERHLLGTMLLNVPILVFVASELHRAAGVRRSTSSPIPLEAREPRSSGSA